MSNINLLAASSFYPELWLIIVIALVFISEFVIMILRYKRCPSDKIMVIYGKVGVDKDGNQRSCKCLHGGAAFIVPVFQSYEFLDLNPIPVKIDLIGALSSKEESININARYMVGISTESGVMQNAAERLLGLKTSEIHELAQDIIFGQMRIIISETEFAEIRKNRNEFLNKLCGAIENELKKIGLRLINVNIESVKCDP
jgi:flotillin